MAVRSIVDSVNSNLLVQMTEQRDGVPVFFVPSAGATFLSFVHLARGLKSGGSVYAFDATVTIDAQVPPSRIEAVAAAFVKEIRARRAEESCRLVGHCWGGIVALEIAAQLESMGWRVASLVLLESFPPRPLALQFEEDGNGAAGKRSEAEEEIDNVIRLTFAQMNRQLSRLPPEQADILERRARAQIRMCSSYHVPKLEAPVFLIKTTTHSGGVLEDWAAFFEGRFSAESMPGDTYTMLSPPNVGYLARKLDRIFTDH